MLTGNKIYILANIESVQNLETGDREKKVSCAKILVNKVELVGVNTAQLGQIQGLTFHTASRFPESCTIKKNFCFATGNCTRLKPLEKRKNRAICF